MKSRIRTAIVLAVVAALSPVLAACWDKTELNQLALVSMAGVDSDPESGEITVYYQIINPLSGPSAKGMPGGSEQSPVYTYAIKGRSYGEIRSNIYKILPRKLFVAHYKVIIVSQRAAKQGIRNLINFIEMMPTNRAAVPMLVAAEPIDRIMNTITPLEKVPSDAIVSRLDMLIDHSLIAGKQNNINDLIERMEKSDPIVMPILSSKTESDPSNSGGISANINANQNSFIIGGGAVFQDYRMTGELTDQELVWYHLLNGERGRQVRRFVIGGKPVSIEWRLVHLERTVQREQDRPVVRIHLELEFSSLYSSEYLPRTSQEIQRMEHQIGGIISDELEAFYEKMKEQGWDLLRIKDLLRRNRFPDAESAYKQAEVVISARAQLSEVGMSSHY